MPMVDARSASAAPGSLRRTLLLYLGALLAVFAVALLFAARDYGQRAANRSYDHLLVSSALSIADSVASDAVAREEVLPAGRIPGTRSRGRRRCDRLEVGKDAPDVGVGCPRSRMRRHLCVRHAVANRAKQRGIGTSPRPHLRDVRPANASCVHPVAIGAAHAVGAHAGGNRVGIPF